MNTPFEELKNVIQSMKPDYRERLLKAHKRFGELRTLCEARGYTETLPQLRGIRVLKHTKEVKELKEVIDTLKPANFKWEDTKTTEK